MFSPHASFAAEPTTTPGQEGDVGGTVAPHLLEVLKQGGISPAADASRFSGVVKIGGAEEGLRGTLQMGGGAVSSHEQIQKITTNNALVINVPKYSPTYYFPGLVWNTSETITDTSTTPETKTTRVSPPKLGIWGQMTDTGSKMYFGTSSSSGGDMAATAGITNQALTIDQSGQVGIGIQNPGEKLDVAGNIRSSDGTRGAAIVSDTSGGGRSYLLLDKNAVNGIGIGSDYLYLAQESARGVLQSAGGTPLIFGSNAEHMRIGATGNVGIGTASPGSKLDVAGTITSNADQPFYLTSIGSGTYTKTVVYNNAANGLYIDLAKTTDSISGTPINFHIDARGGGKDFFHISGSNGNVGIGTATPASPLQVKKAGWDGLNLETTGTASLGRVANDSNGLNMATNARWNGSAWVRDDTSKSSFATIQHLGNSRTEFRVAPPATGNIAWNTAMTIQDSGNVGIGYDPMFGFNVNAPNTSFLRFGSTAVNNKASAKMEFAGWGILHGGLRFIPLDTSNNQGKFIFSTGGDDDPEKQANLFTIQQNGNIGTGTTNPIEKFQVQGGSIFGISDNSQDARVKLRTNNANGNYNYEWQLSSGQDKTFRLYRRPSDDDSSIVTALAIDASSNLSIAGGLSVGGGLNIGNDWKTGDHIRRSQRIYFQNDGSLDSKWFKILTVRGGGIYANVGFDGRMNTFDDVATAEAGEVVASVHDKVASRRIVHYLNNPLLKNIRWVQTEDTGQYTGTVELWAQLKHGWQNNGVWFDWVYSINDGPYTVTFEEGAQTATATEPKGNNNYWDFYTGFAFNDTGSLGVGTSSPTEKLSVKGNISIDEAAMGYGGSGRSGYGIAFPSTGNDAQYVYGEHDGGDASNLIFHQRDNAGDGVIFRNTDCCGGGQLDYMKISRDKLFYVGGNVGIGTSTPSDKLDVAGNITLSGGAKEIRFRNASGAIEQYVWHAGSSLGLGRGSENNSMFVTSTGNVGIGTAGPTIKFAVGDTDTGLNWAGDGMLDIYSNNINTISARSGSVGIGTTSPSNNQGWGRVLDVHGADHAKLLVTNDAGVKTGFFSHNSWDGAAGSVGTESNHPLRFLTNYSEKMRITSSGNVGIGTANPQADRKLHVTGPIRMETGAGAWNWLEVVRGGDTIYFGSDETNRGIWSNGTRDVGMYTNGIARLLVRGDTGNIEVGGGYSNGGISLLTDGTLQVGKDIYLKGNIYRENLQQLAIKNNTLILNAGGSPQDAFIKVDKTNGQIKWNNSANQWDVSPKVSIPGGAIDNAAFNGLLRLDVQNSEESLNGAFSEAKPSYGIEFRRKWHDQAPYNIQAGIYAWGSGSWSSGLAFRTSAAGPSLGTRMVITGDGNVGIGTTDPKAKLHVSAGDSSLALFGPNAKWSGRLYVGAAETKVDDTTAQVISTDGNLHLDAANGNNIYLGYYNASNTYINPNGGNVGIGTIDPSGQRLRVSGGDIGTDGDLNFSGATDKYQDSPWYGIGFNDNTVDRWHAPGPIMQLGGYFGLQFAEQGAIRMAIKGGNVGIGTTGPGRKLEVYGGSSDTFIHVDSNDNYKSGIEFAEQGFGAYDKVFRWGVKQYYDGVDDVFHIDPIRNTVQNTGIALKWDGSVGIGTTSPSQKLDVNGNAIVQGTLNVSSHITTPGSVSAGNIVFRGTGGNSGQSYNHYGIYQEPGDWTHPYPDLMIEYHTGIKYVAYYNYGGHRFYAGYSADASPTTEVFSIGNGDNNTRVKYNLLVDGNVGIGTTDPGAAYKLDVNGTINATDIKINGNPISTSQWTTTGANIYYNSGDVGIGTTDPKNKLHVAGAIGATDWVGAGCEINCSNDAFAIMYPTGNVTTYAGSGGGWGYNQLHFSSGWGTGGLHATIGSGYSGVSSGGIMLGTPLVPWRSNFGAKVRFASDQNASYYWDWGMSAEAGGSTDRFDLRRNNTQLLSITNTGNVGIGTTANITEKLSLGGSKPAIDLGADAIGREVNAGKIAYQRWTDGLDIVGAGGPGVADRKVRFHSAGGVNLDGPLGFINDSTHVGKIFFGQMPNPRGGLSADNGKSLINDYGVNDRGLILQAGYSSDMGGIKITDDGVAIFGAGDDDLLRLIDEDSNLLRMVVDDSGRVGIGKRPSYPLDVQGNINVSYGGDNHVAFSGEEKKKFATDRIGLDVAEIFTTDDIVEVGDILVVSDKDRKLKKSNQPYEGDMVGVVSGAPALLFEGSELQLGADKKRFEKGVKPPVALSGRVPVKVSTENGTIKPGDYLTSSTIPGVAMKATEPGMTIGVALEGYDGKGVGAVLVFINVGEKNTQKIINKQSEVIQSLQRRLDTLERKFRW